MFLKQTGCHNGKFDLDNRLPIPKKMEVTIFEARILTECNYVYG